jgi:anti-sigma regulatory factor (Ser/Thr protein kinase)
MQVVTAVSEAFNNIVLHAYAGREDGIIEMKIRTRKNYISIELRDFGDSFDPARVPRRISIASRSQASASTSSRS